MAYFHVIVLFKARTAVKYQDNIHRHLHSVGVAGILMWKQNHIQRRSGYKWNTTWVYLHLQYSAFRLKICIRLLGFFPWYAARWCILFIIHLWNTILHRCSSSFLVLYTHFCLCIVFFHYITKRKKAMLIQVHKTVVVRRLQVDCREFSNHSSTTYMTDGVIKIEVSSTSRASWTKGNDET